jgi:ParB family chromosome partitioning protein
VAAFVESMDDETLFIEMERENRGREDLSAWEQGVSYARALDDGLFASARKLSEKIGIDVGQIGKAVSLAKLPKEVVEAFSSPLDLQYRFAKPLKDALDKSPDDVLSRAQAIKQAGEKLSGKEVLSRLINGMQPEGEVASNKVKKVSLKGKGGQLGGIQFNRDTRSAVITVKNVDPTRFAEVQQLVADFLNKS